MGNKRCVSFDGNKQMNRRKELDHDLILRVPFDDEGLLVELSNGSLSWREKGQNIPLYCKVGHIASHMPPNKK